MAYTADELKNLSEEDRKRKRHSLESDLVMLESEGRKFLSEKNNLNAEIRKLMMDQERLRMNLDKKKKSVEKIDYQLRQNEEEISRTKKKINVL